MNCVNLITQRVTLVEGDFRQSEILIKWKESEAWILQ